jgi:hypothetical protein
MFLQVCPVCEHRNPRGSRFCNECGSPLQLRFCPECHAAEDVMSLECRSCGAKLPPLPVESPVPGPADVEPDGGTIWKPDAPPPGLHLADDGVVVTVHGDAGADPILEPNPDPAPEWGAMSGLELPLLSERVPEPDCGIEFAATQSLPKTKQPTVIERLHDTPPEFEAPLPPWPASQPPIAENLSASSELTAESESEIEISAEAETLVEASVAPVTYLLPEEIAIAETAEMDEFAIHLREGPWRSAISVDTDEETRLAPVLVHVPLPQKRRLSMRRIGLVVAVAVSATATVVYSARLAPGTWRPAPAPTAAPTQVPGVNPVQRAAGAVQPAAGLTAAVPAGSAANSIKASPSAPPAATATEEKREKVQSTLPASSAGTETPGTVAAQHDPARRPTPAPAATREAVAPPVAQVRPAPVEKPRPCTPAIAALGLCTLESNQEGK